MILARVMSISQRYIDRYRKYNLKFKIIKRVLQHNGGLYLLYSEDRGYSQYYLVNINNVVLFAISRRLLYKSHHYYFMYRGGDDFLNSRIYFKEETFLFQKPFGNLKDYPLATNEILKEYADLI